MLEVRSVIKTSAIIHEFNLTVLAFIVTASPEKTIYHMYNYTEKINISYCHKLLNLNYDNSQTSEQIGIRAQQQLQQIQARIQQLMSRQVRSDIENRQLQQLLHYRQKVIVKVKAQLAQLSHQQRLANLSMGQQSRDKPGTADAGK